MPLAVVTLDPDGRPTGEVHRANTRKVSTTYCGVKWHSLATTSDLLEPCSRCWHPSTTEPEGAA